MLAAELSDLATLKKSRYLYAVPDLTLKKFLPLIRREAYQTGTLLLSQGEKNREIFIILDGSVSVKTDNRQLYSLARTGDIFGEMTVVTGQPSPSSVEVKERLDALVISTDLIQDVKDDQSHELNSLFFNWLSHILADKLHLTSEKAKKFEDASAELRESLSRQQKITENLMKTTAELKKSKAELEELNNLKTELIGIASHDLRSPLGSVITAMETIPACYELDHELIDLLTEVKETCSDQLTLVNALLDLTKIESGRLQLDIMEFSFDQCLQVFREAIKGTRLLARNKQLDITTEICPDLENSTAISSGSAFIRFDVPKIQQVLNNLVGNAVKFSVPGGAVSLQLALSDEFLKISVCDNGPGIPANELNRIFDKFHQVKQRRVGGRGDSGCGLGLAICKNMVELHGGRIWVESGAGQGAAFSFTLPLVDAGRLARK